MLLLLCQHTDVSTDTFLDEINFHTDSRKMWSNISALCGKLKISTCSIILQQNSSFLTNPKYVAQSLANHFYESSASSYYSPTFLSHINTSEAKPIAFPNLNHLQYNQDFSMHELEWSLKRCTGKSAGLDNIPYPFLQNLPYTCKKNTPPLVQQNMG